MSLSNNLINIFEQLPMLPLTQIASNINNSSTLIKLAFKSQKWRCAILSPTLQRNSLVVRVDENQADIGITSTMWSKNYSAEVFFLQNGNDNAKSDSSYHRNLIDAFHFLNTNLSSISLSRLEITDAKWMQISDLMKINCYQGIFGANRLKTRDFRVFLLHWFNGISCQEANHYTFQMTQEQVEKIDINEILKDLNAVPWDPKSRDRKFQVSDPAGNYLLPIDLADGFDFRHPDGSLATIHIDQNTCVLHFCVWGFVFVQEYLDDLMLENVVNANEKLARYGLTPQERLKHKEERKKHLQSLRNIREDQSLDITDVVYKQRYIFPE